jgi:hypothetical protein
VLAPGEHATSWSPSKFNRLAYAPYGFVIHYQFGGTHGEAVKPDLPVATGAGAHRAATADYSPGCTGLPRRLGFDLWPVPRFRARSPRRGSLSDRAWVFWSNESTSRG